MTYPHLDDTEVINLLLSTEIIPLSLRTRMSNTEHHYVSDSIMNLSYRWMTQRSSTSC